MNITVRNRCSDFHSYRAARVKSLFNAESGCNFDLTAELPIDDQAWRIGLIVGRGAAEAPELDAGVGGVVRGESQAVGGVIGAERVRDGVGVWRSFPGGAGVSFLAVHLKLFIAGQKFFGAEVLKLCLGRGHEVVGVSSPAMSGERADRLRAAAREAGAPWRPAGELRAGGLPEGTDLILCAHAQEFIGRATRLKARLGAVGYHPSMLPLHRGRDAVAWAVRLRERITGGSIYWLNETVDGGDLAAQEHVLIRAGDTATELWRRELFPLGLYLFDRVLGDLEAGRVVRVPQDHSLATWEPALDRPPVFRPELPQLGSIEGFSVVRRFESCQEGAR